MLGFGKRKKEQEEEDLCCYYCEYADRQGEDTVFCKKKKKDVAAEGNCLSFAYDLLKRRPMPPKRSAFSDLEFPQI
ncbi:MAG: hypothetical protein J6M12_03235 [Clostridia bacterium]|nr:hypothetical protein [Clostridia bacterium]